MYEGLASDLPPETNALIGPTLPRYHEMRRADLVPMVPLAQRVDQSPANDPQAPTALAREMADHAEIIGGIGQLTNAAAPPGHASGACRSRYSGTATLLDELGTHIVPDTDAFYPRFEPAA